MRDAADSQKHPHSWRSYSCRPPRRGQGSGRLDRDLLCLHGVVNQCQRAPAEKSEALRAVVVALARRQLERERQGQRVLQVLLS